MNRVSTSEELSQHLAPARAVARDRSAGAPLSVGVVVDLFWEPEAGGHVKCWERFAEAAANEPGLDLTIYYLGESKATVRVADNVRYITRRPLLDTNSVWFLERLPDHTDLAPFHPRFARHWRRHHVLHTTDAFFTLARTALRYTRVTGRPLVNSIHTDTPAYTRVYSHFAVHRFFGGGRLSRWMNNRVHLHERLGRMMERKLDRYLRRCDWVLGNEAEDMKGPRSHIRENRFSVLRRGIDKEAFSPRHRDRDRLQQQLGIGRDEFVVLYAGRLAPDKSVLTVARAARLLLDRGSPIHVIFAGDGSEKSEITALLNGRATLPGAVPQDQLAWLYASADLFVFPSQNEISPNVVVEAKASGLPIVVSAEGGSSHFVRRHAEDGIILEDSDPGHWADAIESLRSAADLRAAMGARARQSIELEWPSWRDVLREDLLPVWQRVAREKNVWA
jgi:glycosyltransferase involved in cell wall biosynthesis